MHSIHLCTKYQGNQLPRILLAIVQNYFSLPGIYKFIQAVDCFRNFGSIFFIIFILRFWNQIAREINFSEYFSIPFHKGLYLKGRICSVWELGKVSYRNGCLWYNICWGRIYWLGHIQKWVILMKGSILGSYAIQHTVPSFPLSMDARDDTDELCRREDVITFFALS